MTDEKKLKLLNIAGFAVFVISQIAMSVIQSKQNKIEIRNGIMEFLEESLSGDDKE